MAIRVGILTSGGDCPGLNATIRGVAKALYNRMGDKVEIVGILNGYDGLINGNYREMSPDEFSGILTVGGTILGTKRTPFKKMRVVEEDKVDKVAAMKKNYRAAKLDCLLCLGGNGTHKTANLLSQEGLNIIGLPKTIDNDIYGTDVTFGFHTAVDIATEVIDRIHTTAGSHSRVMCIEIMGNKAGWLTLYSGIAGGADIILIPEMPYDIKKVAAAVESRAKAGKNFSILAVAEGAFSVEEAKMKRKEWTAKRAQAGYTTATARIAHQIEDMTGAETRICVPGHMQRGGSPSAYDRVLATQFGSYAASLVADEHYGVTVAMVNRHVTANPLADIAAKPAACPAIATCSTWPAPWASAWADFYGIPLSKSALPFGRALLLIPDKNSAELPAVLHPGRIPPGSRLRSWDNAPESRRWHRRPWSHPPLPPKGAAAVPPGICPAEKPR